MEKRIIKSLIVEKQEEIRQIELSERPLFLEDTINYVFVGIRRAGKSYLLYQHIQHLIKSGQASIEDILYVNFEDERISMLKAEELHLFLECYKEMYDKKPLIYLDEIQNIEGWEKFVRRLADSKYRVFVTGSNARMLSKEIYTTLGGRFIAKEIFSFTFREYLSYHHIELDKNWEYADTSIQVTKLFQDYFYYGGFAESFPLKDKRSWLNALYQKVLLGDVISRNEIRNENAIKILVKKLAESVMQPSSLARIKNIIDSTGTSISRNTLVDYLQYLTDAYLIFGISNFSDKLSEKETFKKRYFFDNGLLNNFLFDPETKLLENMVAIALKQKYNDDLFFYNKNIEVDFFIPKERLAIQVSYSLSDEVTLQREKKALIKLSEIQDIQNMEIVTWDEEGIIEENGMTISITPVRKWLLKK
jgi:Predicted ATPase (AAA+ superfamily)